MGLTRIKWPQPDFRHWAPLQGGAWNLRTDCLGSSLGLQGFLGLLRQSGELLMFHMLPYLHPPPPTPRTHPTPASASGNSQACLLEVENRSICNNIFLVFFFLSSGNNICLDKISYYKSNILQKKIEKILRSQRSKIESLWGYYPEITALPFGLFSFIHLQCMHGVQTHVHDRIYYIPIIFHNICIILWVVL